MVYDVEPLLTMEKVAAGATSNERTSQVSLPSPSKKPTIHDSDGACHGTVVLAVVVQRARCIHRYSEVDGAALVAVTHHTAAVRVASASALNTVDPERMAARIDTEGICLATDNSQGLACDAVDGV